LLEFDKTAFLCMHFGDRRTDKRTEGQLQCVKVP